jgi:hypothetical protein
VIYRILAKAFPSLRRPEARRWGTGSYGSAMKRTHALLIAVVLALSAVAGTFAALRTTQLGARQAAHGAVLGTAQIAQRNRALDRAQAALAAELRKQPPPLPPASAAGATPASAQTVIYVRPKPIVHVIHRHGSEHENERGSGAGFDD